MPLLSRNSTLLSGLMFFAAAFPATLLAQSIGIVDQPCPPPMAAPANLVAARQSAFDPKSPPPGPDVFAAPDVVAWFQANAERSKKDWANLCRYRAENEAMAKQPPPRVLFIGDSITEAWIEADPAFFGATMIDRGISGQTSQQVLARFYQDVIALHPKAVHILAGTNDVAGNLGPSRAQDVINNIAAMIDIAKAHHIAVVLGSIPPAADFVWRLGLRPAEKIIAINRELRKLARLRKVVFADYHRAMADTGGGMRNGLSSDGVHPNLAGYAIMEPLARSGLKTALRQNELATP